MRAAVACLIAVSCFAQQPEFDAASVKTVDLASHPVFGNSGGPGTNDPGRIHFCCVGMWSLIQRAYDVQIDQISGPSWIMDNMGPNLYEVDATMAVDTTKTQYQLMMQHLLATRFHLAIHREKKNFPAYELVVAKDGPKMKESKVDPNYVAPETPQRPKHDANGVMILPPGPQMGVSLGRGMIRVQVQQKPVSELISGMGSWILESSGGDFRDFAAPKPRVVDKTGLTGTYDFTLEFACDSCRNMGAGLPLVGAGDAGAESTPESSGLPTIFAALEKLGLKLVKTNDVPLDVIVVDHVDKAPTDN